MADLEKRIAQWFGEREGTRLGKSWAVGALGVFLGALALGAVLCLHFPALLTAPELRAVYPMEWIRRVIGAGIVVAFLCGLASALLRPRKALGAAAMGLALVATLLGGADVAVDGPVRSGVHLGLDWFLLSLLLTALVFVPLERSAPLRPAQGPFRAGWLTDLGWFFLSHSGMQVISLLVLLPAATLTPHFAVPALQGLVLQLPLPVQFLAVVLVADFTQYWVHRAFHVWPLLWRFHRVHHSVEAMDWLAGSRLHVVDVVVTRGLVLVPIALLGFAQPAVYAYLVFVSMHAVFIHANFAPRAPWLERLLVMPRFHHWHHAVEGEAHDRNFAVHLPQLDRLFGTAYEPDRWPQGYGLGAPPPAGVWRQLLWPFRR
jgi:sterol desaturase/sphingolipid hydroxylase (fatty acid hydroxylase superfamily)